MNGQRRLPWALMHQHTTSGMLSLSHNWPLALLVCDEGFQQHLFISKDVFRVRANIKKHCEAKHCFLRSHNLSGLPPQCHSPATWCWRGNTKHFQSSLINMFHCRELHNKILFTLIQLEWKQKSQTQYIQTKAESELINAKRGEFLTSVGVSACRRAAERVRQN